MIAVDQSLNTEGRSERDLTEPCGSETLSGMRTESGAFDPETILAEVQRRYEDGSRTRPRTAKLLFEENPDLNRYYSVLNTRAREFFGRTFGKELLARGIIDKGAPKRAPQIAGQVGLAAGIGAGTSGVFASLNDTVEPGEPPAKKPANGKLGLEERRKHAIADLKKCYPNGKVARLDANHKKLGERLTKLYRELGYSSRREMIESFGFEMMCNKGGRPSTVNAEEVLTELQRRYEGKPVPGSVKELLKENPDLSGNLKTISLRLGREGNSYGASLGEELIARGLIEKKLVKSVAVQQDHAARAERRKIETEQILAALDAMEKSLAEVPVEDRPSSMVGICRRFPEYEELISVGRRKGIVSQRILRERGILRLSKAALAAEKKRVRLSHVRNQELPALLEWYESLNGPSFVDGEHHGELLGDGVLGFDLASMSELRETVISVENVWPMSVGNLPAVEFVRFKSKSYAFRLGCISISNDADPAYECCTSVDVSGLDEFTATERFEGETPFKALAGTRVESTFMLAGRPFAALRYRFVVKLSKATLLYALRALGVPVGF